MAASTLVESCVFPYNIPANPHQNPHPTITLTAAPLPLEPSTAQLASLASQHHTSEYNKLKFGIQGCPTPYLPLSVQLPDHFRELQHRQVQCSQEKSWWPCKKPEISPVIVMGPGGAQPQEAANLQEEIQAAMAEPLHNTPLKPCSYKLAPNRLLHPSIKTSSTHPINFSSIIPTELIPLISSHLLLNLPLSSPTLFEIPQSFSLDRLILSPHHQNTTKDYSPMFSHHATSPTSVRPLRTRSSVSEALHAAMNGGLSNVDSNKSKRDDSKTMPPRTFLPRSASAIISPSQAFLTTLHPNASSMSLSLSLTIAKTPSSPPPFFNVNSTTSTSDPGSKAHDYVKRLLIPASTKNNPEWEAPLFPSHLLEQPPPIPPSSTSFSIGNLFLSSCPGKKVRLQGPVKGRSGVCRDLDTDIKRVKDLGVGCIICCLDDHELNFLGVPWVEYEECARTNGIDVLRIPIPEGLAPLTAASLDTDLTYLINTYTMHGIPLLVHCRGGVGRAGVVACCWIIKLGLCGWIDTEEKSSSPTSSFIPNESASSHLTGPGIMPTSEVNDNVSIGMLRRSTVGLVERVISVVRKRRSMKAVETYEQVRFLVDFIEHLRDGERLQ